MQITLLICGDSFNLGFSVYKNINVLFTPRKGEKINIADCCFEVYNVGYDFDSNQINILCKKYYNDPEECTHDVIKLKSNGFSIKGE